MSLGTIKELGKPSIKVTRKWRLSEQQHGWYTVVAQERKSGILLPGVTHVLEACEVMFGRSIWLDWKFFEFILELLSSQTHCLWEQVYNLMWVYQWPVGTGSPGSEIEIKGNMKLWLAHCGCFHGWFKQVFFLNSWDLGSLFSFTHINTGIYNTKTLNTSFDLCWANVWLRNTLKLREAFPRLGGVPEGEVFISSLCSCGDLFLLLSWQSFISLWLP